MGNVASIMLSVCLSAGRNILSKKIAASRDKAGFFLSQGVLFLSAAVLLLFCGALSAGVSALTWLYGGIYGILLVLAQWMFTLSLRTGATSICTVVYSLGFLIPTLSGAIFWNEGFSFFQGCGVMLAVVVILLTFQKGETAESGGYVFFLLVAMLASGGLGIMQKVQQSSTAAGETGGFLLIAFIFAGVCSVVAFLLCGGGLWCRPATMVPPAIAGLCFGGANLCNTLLAGRLPSAVFFPVQNISTILLSTVLGVVIFREKLSARVVGIVLLGAAVVWLCSR